MLFGIQDCHFFARTFVRTDLHGHVIDTQPDPNSFYIGALGFAPFVSNNGACNNPFTTTTVTTSIPSIKTTIGTTTTTTSDGITTKMIVTNKNGTITTTTQKTSTSALRLGADFQAEFNSPIITDFNFFYISPFYQTDYRNAAQITGLDLVY
jgi:hypothetical protein